MHNLADTGIVALNPRRTAQSAAGLGRVDSADLSFVDLAGGSFWLDVELFAEAAQPGAEPRPPMENVVTCLGKG